MINGAYYVAKKQLHSGELKNLHMKNLLIILFSLLAVSGCRLKKTQEQIAEDIIVKAMTEGRWVVTVYNDGSDYLSEFNGYEFQFKSDRTVDAIKSGSTEETGMWLGDGLAMTISSQFPSGSNPTLLRLNGVWKIVNNNWTWVKATQTINGKLTTLELQKK